MRLKAARGRDIVRVAKTRVFPREDLSQMNNKALERCCLLHTTTLDEGICLPSCVVLDAAFQSILELWQSRVLANVVDTLITFAESYKAF